MTFQDHLRTVATLAFSSITAAEAKGIYAVSLFIDNEADDPRQPVLTIGYNTEDQFRRSVADASDEAEARWNYAFWLQNELAVIGDLTCDPAEADFNQACVRLAQDLHNGDVIEGAIGRRVPVIVHELEYYEAIARRTEAANPPGLADEFTAWVRNG